MDNLVKSFRDPLIDGVDDGVDGVELVGGLDGQSASIHVLETDIRKRTIIGALPIYNCRKEMAIVSNEPGDVATAGERILIQLENVMMKYYMT